jgi:hypothetical protein
MLLSSARIDNVTPLKKEVMITLDVSFPLTF